MKHPFITILVGTLLTSAVAGIATGTVIRNRKKIDKYEDQRKGSKKSTKRK